MFEVLQSDNQYQALDIRASFGNLHLYVFLKVTGQAGKLKTVC